MIEQERTRLSQLTKELLKMNEEAERYYIEVVKQEGYEVDFYGKVKPFADKMKQLTDEWLPLAEQFVKTEKPLNLHPIQLTQTVENIEIVAIKSFFADTGKKRQIETFKSVAFVLHQVINSLQKH
ncbi:YppE family protein [Halalkalibacter urbisdiaboli]|uniref:YppE family protein n=1 Tax=Halalkalibacter urbisdiaboli TaxID=1960589 RepID=UPI001FD8AEDA|nr:YppE family protein [Halalkalibacter urbisdiaboli]